MQVETLFQFINEDSIRIDGTRIGIETVIGTYKQGASPEEIILRYPTLSLLQVHATITYYLSNKDEVEAIVQGNCKNILSIVDKSKNGPKTQIQKTSKTIKFLTKLQNKPIYNFGSKNIF